MAAIKVKQSIFCIFSSNKNRRKQLLTFVSYLTLPPLCLFLSICSYLFISPSLSLSQALLYNSFSFSLFLSHTLIPMYTHNTIMIYSFPLLHSHTHIHAFVFSSVQNSSLISDKATVSNTRWHFWTKNCLLCFSMN